MTKTLPQRKRPAHGVHRRHDRPKIVYDTVCVRDRQFALDDSLIHDLLRDVWTEADRWRVGRYMIMPDHIHYFAAPSVETHDLEPWVKYWKSIFRKRSGIALQTGHWDTRIRSAAHYQQIWEYIVQNPVRKGLVAAPELWPYQGELYELPWR